jgi:hypothetical protein
MEGFMKSRWIKWSGGDCPVDDDVEIEVRLGDGSQYAGKACQFARGRWLQSIHFPPYKHITAYRVMGANKK